MEKSRKPDKFLWLEHLFESAFKLAYTFNISPIKIAFDDKQGVYSIKSSKFRQIFCLIPTLMMATFEMISIIAAVSQITVQTPTMIFRIATESGDIFLCFMLWYVIWFRQEDIARYFSLLSLQRSKLWKTDGKNKDDTGNTFNLGKTQAFLVCSLTALVVCACNVLQTAWNIIIVLGLYSIGADSLLGFVYVHVCRGLFMEPGQILQTGEMNTLQLSISCISIFAYLSYRALYTFALLLCLGGVVVVSHNCWKFTNFLQEETNDLIFMRRLQSFKEEVESVNQVIGPIMFGVAIVAAPPFLVINLSRMVTTWDIGTLLIALTCFLYCAILMGAAEVSYKTDAICEWILAYGEGDHEDNLFAIYVELSQSPIGLRGVECLTVTYRYMAQMFTAVVTFGIILLQFVSAPGGDNLVLSV